MRESFHCQSVSRVTRSDNPGPDRLAASVAAHEQRAGVASQPGVYSMIWFRVMDTWHEPEPVMYRTGVTRRYRSSLRETSRTSRGFYRFCHGAQLRGCLASSQQSAPTTARLAIHLLPARAAASARYRRCPASHWRSHIQPHTPPYADSTVGTAPGCASTRRFPSLLGDVPSPASSIRESKFYKTRLIDAGWLLIS